MPNFSRIEKSNKNISLTDTRNKKTEDINDTAVSKSSKKISLLLEGKSDRFYEQYIKYFCNNNKIKSNISIVLMGNNSNPNFPIPAEYRKYMRGAIEYYVNEHKPLASECIPQKPNTIGIIDRDFDRPDDITIEHYLECTDGNDLETTLLLFDYTGMEKIFSEETHNKDILQNSITNAFQLGKIRYAIKHLNDYNKQKNISKKIYNIKSFENESNGYYGYSKETPININTIIDKLHIYSNDKKFILNIINNLSENCPLMMCRGHDVFNFVACYYADILSEKNPDNTYAYHQILQQRKKYEKMLEEHYINSNYPSFSSSRISEFLEYHLKNQ